jgi:hypothetical protein
MALWEPDHGSGTHDANARQRMSGALERKSPFAPCLLPPMAVKRRLVCLDQDAAPCQHSVRGSQMSAAAAAIDPRILIIARAIGRQIARDQLDTLREANDNRPNDER